MSSQKILQAWIVLSAVLIMGTSAPLLGADQKPSPTKAGKIQIHTFALKGKTEKITYYASILPKTLYQYLKETGRYAPVLEKGDAPPIDVQKPGSPLNKSVLKEISNRKKNIHYVCTGIIEAIPTGGTSAIIIIYNVKTDTIKIIPASRLESGVVLGTSMDTLSDSVIKKFDFAVAEARRVENTSPYLGVYRFMSRLNFGIASGYTFLVGDFSDFDNALEVRTHLGYDLSPLISNLSVRWNGAYLSTGFGDESLRLWNIGLSLNYALPFSKHFSISGAIGSGATFLTIVQYQAGETSPTALILDENDDTRAFLFLGLGVDFNIGPVTLNAGTSYRRVFINNKGIDMVAITGAFVYNL